MATDSEIESRGPRDVKIEVFDTVTKTTWAAFFRGNGPVSDAVYEKKPFDIPSETTRFFQKLSEFAASPSDSEFFVVTDIMIRGVPKWRWYSYRMKADGKGSVEAFYSNMKDDA